MKRILYAIAQIAIVVWAAFVFFIHDLHHPDQIAPFLAAVIIRGWVSSEISDPLFGHQSAQEWAKSQLKRLTPKRQPKSGWNV